MGNNISIKKLIILLIIFLYSTQLSSTAPVADFKTSIAGLKASFIDRSSNNPTSWFWSFGESSSPTNSSSLQNTEHIYSAAGNYKVTLFAVNADGRTVKTETITIIEPPIANFSVSVTGLAANFTDISTKAPTSWAWIFGDSAATSNTSTSQNPSHTYSAPGTYTVTLFAANSGGKSGAKTDITVSISATDLLNAIKTITNYDAVDLEVLLKIVSNSIFNNDSFQGANGGDLVYTLLKGFFDNRTTIGLSKLSDGVNGLLDIAKDKNFFNNTQKQVIINRIAIIASELELNTAINTLNSATDKLTAINTFINTSSIAAKKLRTQKANLLTTP
ncbi:MAG: PKD domain-containing protein [bacterium]